MDVKDLDALFSGLQGCCLHNPQWLPADVEAVLAGLWRGCGGWMQVAADGSKEDTESESVFAVKLKDGGYGLLHESEDYTGHGCRCDAFTGRYGSLGELLAAWYARITDPNWPRYCARK